MVQTFYTVGFCAFASMSCSAGLSLPSFPHHTVTVRYATEHRCGVAVSGPDLSDSVSGTDPLKDGLPLQASHGSGSPAWPTASALPRRLSYAEV